MTRKKKINLLGLSAMLLAFAAPYHDIIGHWVSDGPNNTKAFLDFNKKGEFKVTANGQIENQGTYKLRNDTFSMYDNNCGSKIAGKYKLTFYGNDSISFALIEDSCKDRASEVNGGMIKRIKK